MTEGDGRSEGSGIDRDPVTEDDPVADPAAAPDPAAGPETDDVPETDGDPAADIDPAVAATAREELRTTFTYQVERLREIDTKAIEILKANLVLIGIVVTGGSIVVQTEVDLGGFLNPFTLAGGILLLVSTGLAAVTYTASDLRGGLSIADVDAVIAAERAGPGDDTNDREVGFDERLLRSYAEWIDYNARVTAVNDLLATVTVLLVFFAFVYVVAGVAIGAAGLSAAASWLSFVVLTLIGVWFTWVAAHMDHLGPETRHSAASFDGVQLSKGADRTEAWTSLRAMLGREPPTDSTPEEPPESSDETGSEATGNAE